MARDSWRTAQSQIANGVPKLATQKPKTRNRPVTRRQRYTRHRNASTGKRENEMKEPIAQMRAMMQGDLFGHKVRMKAVGDNALFLARDVCKYLGIKSVSVALRRLEPRDKVRCAWPALKHNRPVWFVNESAFYDLVFLSRKPKAKRIQSWFFSHVLPTRVMSISSAPSASPRDLSTATHATTPATEAK
jgi:prophage antirepressor-like protein